MSFIQLMVIIGGSLVAAIGVWILVQDRLMDQYCNDPRMKRYTINQLGKMSAHKGRQIALLFLLCLVSITLLTSWLMAWLSE